MRRNVSRQSEMAPQVTESAQNGLVGIVIAEAGASDLAYVARFRLLQPTCRTRPPGRSIRAPAPSFLRKVVIKFALHEIGISLRSPYRWMKGVLNAPDG
jgi:hypothetical protein